MLCDPTKHDKAWAQAIWNDYLFDLVVDDEYVRDMDQTAGYLLATGRIRAVKNVLDYTYTARLAAVEPGLVKVPGRFKTA